MIAIVVAFDKKHGIGKDNQLLWHITEDMKFFRNLTQGGTIIMGRKTYDSIGRPLPKRRNIVISRDKNLSIDGVEIVHSIEDALLSVSADEKVFIIGGGEIYKQTINSADILYVTKVNNEYKADTFFPEIDDSIWAVSEVEGHERGVEFEHPFSFIMFKRI